MLLISFALFKAFRLSWADAVSNPSTEFSFPGNITSSLTREPTALLTLPTISKNLTAAVYTALPPTASYIPSLTPELSLTPTPSIAPTSTITPIDFPSLPVLPSDTPFPGILHPVSTVTPTFPPPRETDFSSPFNWLGASTFVTIVLQILVSLFLLQILQSIRKLLLQVRNIDAKLAGILERTTPEPGSEEKPLKPGFAVYVTRSKGKPDENQDAGIAFSYLYKGRYRMIGVADGVGMAKNSSIASKTIVETFKSFLPRLGKSTNPIHQLPEFYSEAHRRIGEALAERGLPTDSAATTFIGVVETHNCHIFTQLADGSAYLLTQSSDDSEFAAIPTLLTTASPDVPPQIGAMGKYQTPKSALYLKPEAEGYMWIIATDGMNDLDRYMEDGTHVVGTEAARALASDIWQSFRQSPSQFTEETIKQVLWRWLKRCQTTDDATLAVLIDGEMFAHWQSLVTA